MDIHFETIFIQTFETATETGFLVFQYFDYPTNRTFMSLLQTTELLPDIPFSTLTKMVCMIYES